MQTVSTRAYRARALGMPVDELYALITDIESTLHRAGRQDEVDGGRRVEHLERERGAYRSEIASRYPSEPRRARASR